MKKQRNCWLRGLLFSAAILSLVLVPRLLSRGLPEPLMPYLLSMGVILGIGTLIFGGIDRYYQREKDKKQA